MPISDETPQAPEIVELAMHRGVFEVVKKFLESNYPLKVYKMPQAAQDDGMTSYGVMIDIRTTTPIQDYFR